MGWHCVHIEQMRPSRALNSTFRKMLVEAFRTLGQPQDCRVYVQTLPDDSHNYYFSLGAAATFKSFVSFWEGCA